MLIRSGVKGKKSEREREKGRKILFYFIFYFYPQCNLVVRPTQWPTNLPTHWPRTRSWQRTPDLLDNREPRGHMSRAGVHQSWNLRQPTGECMLCVCVCV